MNKLNNFWIGIIGLFLCVGLWSCASKIGCPWGFYAVGVVYFIIYLLDIKLEKSESKST